MALDDICPDNSHAVQVSGHVTRSDDSFASLRAAKRPGHARELWRVDWTNLTAAETQTLRAVLEAAGKTGAVAWTPPPGVCLGRAYRIESYTEKAGSVESAFDVSITLLHLPGVQPAF